MAFTEVELAILSQAAYINPPPDGAAEESLHEYLNKHKGKLQEKLGSDYKEHIDALLKKIDGKDYRVVQSVNNANGTGFSAFAVAGPDNEVTVACRGTEIADVPIEDTITDLLADGELVGTIESQQQEQMRLFVERLEADGYDSYTFTGHSLGGNLAMYGAIMLKYPEKLNSCVTFNAPGFNTALLAKNQSRISRIRDRMIAFQNERDFVSESMIVPGKIVVLEHEGLDILEIGGWNAHGMNALIPNKDGSFKRNRTGAKDGTILGALFDKGTDIGDSVTMVLFPVMAAIDFFKWKKKQAKVDCRDFSADAREMLINAAKETEEEKWWQITRWDCWYKIDKFFGGYAADWNRYSGDVDTYYRKLIDMNDSSVKEIKEIFEKVYGIDSKYASTIRAQKDALSSNVTAKLKDLLGCINPVSVRTPLRGQNTNYTCGSASGSMILDALGINCPEAQFWNYANSGGEGTYVYRIRDTLNHFIGEDVYRYVDTSSYSLEEYYNTINASLENGYPVQVVMSIPGGTEFGYSTGGHYVVITGVYKNADGEYIAMVNDPYSGGWWKNGHQGQQLEVKLSDIQQYNKNHSGYIICD